MKRKLLLLDIVLVALIGLVAWQYREFWREAREREQRVLQVRVPPEKTVPLPPLPVYAPATVTNYIDIAQKMLFARDRNPNVIIDPTPPPAPPVMPHLPVFYGLMTGFGDPGIILSEKPGAGQRTYRAGETIGAFKLMSFSNTNIVLDWDGKKVERRLDELVSKEAAPQVASAAPAAAAAAVPQAPVASAPLGPGADTGGGFKACVANDSTPSGTVQGGYRKIETATPFGKSCRWEQVK